MLMKSLKQSVTADGTGPEFYDQSESGELRGSVMGNRSCLQQQILCLVVFAYSSMMSVPVLAANSESGKKLSLIEVAPSVYYTARRYWKFYGDENTTQGSLAERSNLLGNFNGTRDRLVEQGVYIDAAVTQFSQGNLSGGDRDSPDPRTNGSTDLWLWLDSGKADLWSGGALFAHYEANWGTSMNGDVGSMLPANFDATMPRANNPPSAKLSELYYMQALPGNLVASFGKQDMAAWADTNLFANNERTQFTYVGLVSNAIAGVFFPYTGVGAWLDWAPSKEHSLVGVWSQADSKAGQTGIDNLFNSENAYAMQYVYSTDIAKRPGNYLLAGAYSTEDITGFAVTRRRLFFNDATDLIVNVPGKERSDNYAVIGNFAQYLWVDDKSAELFSARPHATKARHHTPPLGVGVFGRAGWAPENRNAIDQFYSFGIGGYGVLIPGRDDDNWGIGWAGSHISDDLRQLTDTIRSWEHAFEVFYNVAVTPAVHLSLDAQSIRPANKSADTAYALGARLQLDF